jgi:peptidoglycan/LPS O-acetylase OafA/YrhL
LAEAILSQNHNTLERLYSLDILRGIAALCVVLHHSHHFFVSGTAPRTYDVATFPFASWLSFIYLDGWMAVDLFFGLSGFIFFWLYSKHISEGKISAGKFALLRFSRLYPLHFATLLLMAAGQIWFENKTGNYFVYQANDLKHFVLNLFFASSWGLESNFSFNGPSWSISVEILLYALFFLYCRLLPIRAFVLLPISMIGFFIINQYYAPIGRGIGSFFLGGTVLLAYRAILASSWAEMITKWSTYLMLSAWVITVIFLAYHLDPALIAAPAVPAPGQDGFYFHTLIKAAISRLHIGWPVMILFPLTILSLALLETRNGPIGKRFSFIGDISYSSYLLHVPLQLIFVGIGTQLAVNKSVYYTFWFQGLFFAALIALSICSFKYFELPAQKLLRLKGYSWLPVSKATQSS